MNLAGKDIRDYELIADRSLGPPLGVRLPLGKATYTVVGLTEGLVGSGGEGLAFFTRADAQALQADVAGEAARRTRAARIDLAHTNWHA